MPPQNKNNNKKKYRIWKKKKSILNFAYMYLGSLENKNKKSPFDEGGISLSLMPLTTHKKKYI